MSTSKEMTDLQDALQKPVVTSPQMEKIMTQSIFAKNKLIKPCWYVSFLRITLVSVGLVIAGHAVSIVLVAIAHYTGLEAWMDSMHHY